MTLPIDAPLKDWKKLVKGRAEFIKQLVNGTTLFGKHFNDTDRDALLVAGYLAGVEQGRVNVERVIAQLENPYRYVDELIKKHNPERAKKIKGTN